MRLKEFNKKVYFPNSMVCMCNTCYELYNVRHINFEPDGAWDVGKCPKLDCHGTLVEIDEMIAPMIRELNNKGYSHYTINYILNLFISQIICIHFKFCFTIPDFS